MSGPEPNDIYRAQTSMLQWLRRRGHQVDFGVDRDFGSPPPSTGQFGREHPMRRYHGQPCPYCVQPMMCGTRKHPTRDHVKPRRAGGTLGAGNRKIVCFTCNHDKADMMMSEFLAWLEGRKDVRAPIIRGIVNG